MENEYQEQFDKARKDWTALKADMEPRMAIWEEIEDAVFLDFDTRGKKRSKDTKTTYDPGPRIKVLGIRNLLASSSPTFNLPKSKNSPDAERVSSPIEKAANIMWKRSNRAQQKRIEAYEATTAIMTDEIHLAVVSTKDDLDHVNEAQAQANKEDNYDKDYWDAEVNHYKEMHSRTPYLFDCLDSNVCYPRTNKRGALICHATEVEKLVIDIKAEFGEAAFEVLAGKDDYDSMNVIDMWYRAYRFTWVEGIDIPLISEPHGLGFLPRVFYRVDYFGK